MTGAGLFTEGAGLLAAGWVCVVVVVGGALFAAYGGCEFVEGLEEGTVYGVCVATGLFVGGTLTVGGV